MSDSAKPAEGVFKSVLAVTLAATLCPLAPVGQSWAQEPEGFPAAAGAQALSSSDDPIVNWTECGTCRWMVDAGGCLVIAPDEGQTQGVLADWPSAARHAPWGNYADDITSVKVESGVSATTAACMFLGLSRVTSMDLSGLDTSKVTNMDSMFEGCSSLASLNVSSFDTSRVTNMYSMFGGCSSLASLDLSNFDTSSVRGMISMFYGCKSLASLDVSNFNTAKVTIMSAMFYDCSSLSTLDVSNFDTSKVTDMGSMFDGCSSLSSLDLSGFDTSNVESMKAMFYGCSSLTALDLSSFDTSNTEDVMEMFELCSSLRAVRLGQGFSFAGSQSSRQCNLPNPDVEKGFTGLWESSVDGVLYSSYDIPSKVAATYFAQRSSAYDRTSIAGAVVSDIPDQVGNGSAVKPAVKVTLNGVRLMEGIDYFVTFKNNVEPGTATAVITGAGDYEGTIEKTFVIVSAPTFPDVDYSTWYGDAVTFVAGKGLITGYSDTGAFGVGDVLTRAQLATILWRNACPDEYAEYDPATAEDETGIDGSADGTYYTAAANWAVREGVITGFVRPDGSQDFAAGEPVTFKQLITILSRIGADEDDMDGAEGDLSAFEDGSSADAWAAPSLAWAAQEGLVTGYIEPLGKYLRPLEDVARERVAVVLMRAFDLDILK